MNYFIYLLLFFISLQIGCIRFKVNHLKAIEVASIPINNKPLSFPKRNGFYYGIPGRIGIDTDKIVISEPNKRSINIFTDQKKKPLVIYSKKFYDPKIKKGEIILDNDSEYILNENLNIPGIIISGKENDFLVQNYIFPSSLPEKNNKKNPEPKGFYKVLHFNYKGNLLGIIGRMGQAELSFENIIWMDVDTDNSLWILYRYLDDLYLDRLYENKLENQFKEKECENILFQGITKKKEMLYICEYMYPFYEGNKILMVGKVEKRINKNKIEDYIFQHRVVKVKDLDSDKITEIFKRLNDAEEFPYIPYDESHIMIWQTKKHNAFKYSIYNLEGDLTKNLQIDLKDDSHSWRATYATLRGDFYSIRIFSNRIYIYQWE